jgi:hypothetical protein
LRMRGAVLVLRSYVLEDCAGSGVFGPTRRAEDLARWAP